MDLAQPGVTAVVQADLDRQLEIIEQTMDGDAIGFFGPILFGVDHAWREALDAFQAKKRKLIVVLDTNGGVVEVVERLVDVARHSYPEVVFVVPDRAMSAGTVFALSGDQIWMDHFSLLGPIDPQVQREKKLIPALAYLKQFERLMAKSTAKTLTTAELALLQKLDLAELLQFELARELGHSLLKRWLVKYKFKDWTHRATSGAVVTEQDKAARAEEIAEALSDPEKWHSHGRGITMATLAERINLRIDDFGQNKDLSSAIRRYFKVTRDFMQGAAAPHLIHTRHFF